MGTIISERSKVSKTVEEFMVKLIRQNLLDVSKGVTRYLEDNA